MDSDLYEGGIPELLKSVSRAMNEEIGRLKRITGTNIKVVPEVNEMLVGPGVTRKESTGRVRIVVTIEGER